MDILVVLGIFWCVVGVFPIIWIITDLWDNQKLTNKGKLAVIIFLPSFIVIGILLGFTYLIIAYLLPLLDNLTIERK